MGEWLLGSDTFLSRLIPGCEAFRGDEGNAEIAKPGGEGLALGGDRHDLAERVKNSLLIRGSLDDAHILLECAQLVLPRLVMRLEEDVSSEDEEDDKEDDAQQLPEARIHAGSPLNNVLLVDDEEVFHGFHGAEGEQVAALLIPLEVELPRIVRGILQHDVHELTTLRFKNNISDSAEELARLAHDALVEEASRLFGFHSENNPSLVFKFCGRKALQNKSRVVKE